MDDVLDRRRGYVDRLSNSFLVDINKFPTFYPVDNSAPLTNRENWHLDKTRLSRFRTERTTILDIHGKMLHSPADPTNIGGFNVLRNIDGRIEPRII